MCDTWRELSYFKILLLYKCMMLRYTVICIKVLIIHIKDKRMC